MLGFVDLASLIRVPFTTQFMNLVVPEGLIGIEITSYTLLGTRDDFRSVEYSFRILQK
jgi:hypothetical protein